MAAPGKASSHTKTHQHQHQSIHQMPPQQQQLALSQHHPHAAVGARLQPMPVNMNMNMPVNMNMPINMPWPAAYMPAAAAASAVPAPLEKKPRPRKPYTTTKAREMWTPEEHSRMLEGLKRYKRDWSKVTAYVGTRSAAQVRSHAQKYFDRVQRDKTDDYVPQARPKRKSSSPYPRKMRPEQPSPQPSSIPTPQTPTPNPHAAPMPQYYSMSPHMYPVESYPGLPPGATILAAGSPQSHPHPLPGSSPYQYSIHPAMYGAPHPHQQHVSPQSMAGHMHPHHVAHPHHPQFIMGHPAMMAAAPVPANTAGATTTTGATGQQQQSRPSPVISSPGNPSQLVRVHHPSAVYSPVPHGVRVARMMPQFAQPMPMPSPMSVDGRTYAISPAHPHPQVMVHPSQHQQHSMYTAATPMSPLTPYPAVAVSPIPTTPTSQGVRGATPLAQKTSYVPQHTHPNGPDPNCAKCNALKRYGNVFQELGAIRSTSSPTTTTNGRGGGTAEKTAAIAKISQKNKKIAKVVGEIDSDSTVKSGEDSTASKDNARENGNGCMYESRNSKSNEKKKAENPQNITGNSKKKPPRSVSPPTANGNSNRNSALKHQISFRRIAKPYDASRPHHTVGPNGEKKTPCTMVGDESANTTCASGSGGRIVSGSIGNGKTVSSIAKVLTTDMEPTAAVGTKRARNSEDGSEKAAGNKKSARYSSSANTATTTANTDSERREIFDAVKSLQILGSTSPSASVSPAGSPARSRKLKMKIIIN